jgi:hypothetical protein
MTKKIILAILACFILLAAGLIYLCFRPHTILLFQWLDAIGFNYSVFQNTEIKPPAFFINNFPNALFLIFGYILFYIVWSNNKKNYLFYISLITFLNIIYEIATRDIDDILTICATFTICLFIYHKYSGVKGET